MQPRLARAAAASTTAAALLLLLAALPSSPPESTLTKTALRRDDLLRRLDNEDEQGSGFDGGSGFDDDEQGDAGSGATTVDNQCTRTLDAYKLQFTDDADNCIYLPTPSVTLDQTAAAGTDCPTPDYSGFENVATVRRRLLPRPTHPPPTHLLRPRAVRRVFRGL